MLTSKYALAEVAGERRYHVFTIQGYGTFRIRSLTEGERAELEYAIVYAEDKDRSQAVKMHKARTIAMTFVDSDGLRLYEDNEASQIAGYDSRFTAAAYDEIEKHIGISSILLDDDAEKNSKATGDDEQHIDSLAASVA